MFSGAFQHSFSTESPRSQELYKTSTWVDSGSYVRVDSFGGGGPGGRQKKKTQGLHVDAKLFLSSEPCRYPKWISKQAKYRFRPGGFWFPWCKQESLPYVSLQIISVTFALVDQPLYLSTFNRLIKYTQDKMTAHFSLPTNLANLMAKFPRKESKSLLLKSGAECDSHTNKTFACIRTVRKEKTRSALAVDFFKGANKLNWKPSNKMLCSSDWNLCLWSLVVTLHVSPVWDTCRTSFSWPKEYLYFYCTAVPVLPSNTWWSSFPGFALAWVPLPSCYLHPSGVFPISLLPWSY